MTAPDAGKSVFEELGDDGAKEAVAFAVAFLVLAKVCVEVPKQALP